MDVIQTAIPSIRHGSIGSNVDNNNNRQIPSHTRTCYYDNNGNTSVVYTTGLGLDGVIRYRMMIDCEETTIDDDNEKDIQDKYSHYHVDNENDMVELDLVVMTNFYDQILIQVKSHLRERNITTVAGTSSSINLTYSKHPSYILYT